MSLPTPSRRTVLRTTAWTVPAIAAVSAAPAFATSCVEVDYRFSWSGGGWNYVPTVTSAPNGAGSGVGTATPDTSGLAPGQVVDPLTVTVSNAFSGTRMSGTTADDGAQNMRLSPFNVGGLDHRGLTLLQRVDNNNSLGANSAARRAHHQTMTFTFSRPVSNLSFTITDIDRSNGQYHDRVEVAPAPLELTKPGTVLGNGSSGDPLRASANGNHDPSTSNAGNARVVRLSNVAVPGFTITFWNNQDGSLSSRGLQGIFVSDLTFTASSCA